MIYWRSMQQGLTRKEQTVFAQQLLADALKKEYGMELLPKIKKETQGKPYFAEYPAIHFNYSHSRDAVICILSDRRTGIDIEAVRPFHEKSAKRFCSDREWAWLEKQVKKDREWIKLWTLKEAYVKYTGIGIRTDLRCVDVLDTVISQKGQKEVLDHGRKKVLYAETIQRGMEQIAVICEQKIDKTICCI